MYVVEVFNPCRCFIRDGEADFMEFSSDAEAKEYAQKLLKYMESDYCKKHWFDLQKTPSGYAIYIKPRN